MEKHVNFKEVELKGREFVIRKFEARTGSFMLIKVTGLIGPMLKGLDISKVKVEEGKIPDISGIDIAGIVSGLASLKEEDFNYIHDKCLQICFENLPAGPTQVMNSDGNFGVSGLDTDSATTLALVAHALIFNVTGFFGGSPLSSVLGGLLGMKSPDAKM